MIEKKIMNWYGARQPCRTEGSTPQSMGIHSLFGGNLEADREAAQQQQQRRIEEFLRRNGVLFEYSVTTTGRASFGLRTVPRERVKKNEGTAYGGCAFAQQG